MFVLVPSSGEVRRLDLRGWGFYISLGIVKLLFKETEIICIPTKRAESAHIKGWEYSSGGRVFALHAHSPGFNPQPTYNPSIWEVQAKESDSRPSCATR